MKKSPWPRRPSRRAPNDDDAAWLHACLSGARLVALCAKPGHDLSALLSQGLMPRCQAAAAEGEVILFIDLSEGVTRQSLLSRLREALPAGESAVDGRDESVPVSLAEQCVAWSRRHGLRFQFVFDHFEQALATPLDRSDQRALRDDILAAIGHPRLDARFVLALHGPEVALLERLRGRVPSLQITRREAPLDPSLVRDGWVVSLARSPRSETERAQAARTDAVYASIESMLTRLADASGSPPAVGDPAANDEAADHATAGPPLPDEPPVPLAVAIALGVGPDAPATPGPDDPAHPAPASIDAPPGHVTAVVDARAGNGEGGDGERGNREPENREPSHGEPSISDPDISDPDIRDPGPSEPVEPPADAWLAEAPPAEAPPPGAPAFEDEAANDPTAASVQRSAASADADAPVPPSAGTGLPASPPPSAPAPSSEAALASAALAAAVARPPGLVLPGRPMLSVGLLVAVLIGLWWLPGPRELGDLDRLLGELPAAAPGTAPAAGPGSVVAAAAAGAADVADVAGTAASAALPWPDLERLPPTAAGPSRWTVHAPGTVAVRLIEELSRAAGRSAGVRLAVLPSQAWAEDLAVLQQPEQLAIARYDALLAAREAPGSVPPLQIVMPLFTEELAFVVRADAPWTRIHDIESRRIDIGPADSARALSAGTAYERLFGHRLAASQVSHQTETQALRALMRGETDVVVLVGSLPSQWLRGSQAAPAGALRLLSLDRDHPSSRRALRAMLPARLATADDPALRPPAAADDGATPTLALLSFLVSAAPAGEARGDAVGSVARLVCEQLPQLQRDGDPKWREVRPDLQLDVGWPYADAARRAVQGCGGAPGPSKGSSAPGASNAASTVPRPAAPATAMNASAPTADPALNPVFNITTGAKP